MATAALASCCIRNCASLKARSKLNTPVLATCTAALNASRNSGVSDMPIRVSASGSMLSAARSARVASTSAARRLMATSAGTLDMFFSRTAASRRR